MNVCVYAHAYTCVCVCVCVFASEKEKDGQSGGRERESGRKRDRSIGADLARVKAGRLNFMHYRKVGTLFTVSLLLILTPTHRKHFRDKSAEKKIMCCYPGFWT